MIKRKRPCSGSWLLGYCHKARSRCMGNRKSTRLNSSHTVISYAVFCLKKKKKKKNSNVRLSTEELLSMITVETESKEDMRNGMELRLYVNMMCRDVMIVREESHSCALS